MVKKRKLAEEETIEIEFALFEPDEADFHGIRPFFVKAWDFSKQPIMDASELANVISGQGNIGNLIKTEGDDPNSFGVVSILNLKQYQQEGLEKSIPSLFTYLQKKCTKVQCESMAKLKDLLSLEKNVGLVVNERIATLPAELIPVLHDNLSEDVKWSQTTPECPKEEQRFYFFDTLIGICSAFKYGDELVYTKFEDESYVRNSSFHFAFPVRDSEYRVFFALDFEKLPAVLKDIHGDAVAEAQAPAEDGAADNGPQSTNAENVENTLPPMKKKRKKKR